MAKNTLVIFGATGDLTHRKLLPALWKGFARGRFSELDVLGVARRPWDDKIFRESVKAACQPKDEGKWKAFEKKLHYFLTDVSSDEAFSALSKNLSRHENLLFFLATAPNLFEKISQNLAAAKNRGFKRLMIEKPFGQDLASARRLHKVVDKAFGDEVYAIDHYLGKSIVRNLLVMRFSNSVFSGVWNRHFIESIQIIHSEDFGVEHRASYYDAIGALSDMVQSHLLQVLSRITMERPLDWTPESFSRERARVLNTLSSPSQVVVGQYSGYAQDVGHPSQTETFVALKTHVNNDRWRGVPMYILTGKKLDRTFAQIMITFKSLDYMGATPATTLTVTLHPEERFMLTFNLRRPGQGTLEPFRMEYCQSCEFRPHTPEAYEALFEDALRGEKRFFVRWPEIEASWKFIEAVKKKAGKLRTYEDGSNGPAEALKITEWKDYVPLVGGAV